MINMESRDERERECIAEPLMPHTQSGMVGANTLSSGVGIPSVPYKDILGGVNDMDGCCKTIRSSGRNDIHKKHSWDLVYG